MRVRGYEIERLPLGGYLKAVEAMRSMPAEIMTACYPGMTVAEVLTSLKTIDRDTLSELIIRLISVLPEKAIALIALLTGIEEDKLLEDTQIGLDGACELVEAFFTLNGIENFIKATSRIGKRLGEAGKDKANTGSNV